LEFCFSPSLPLIVPQPFSFPPYNHRPLSTRTSDPLFPRVIYHLFHMRVYVGVETLLSPDGFSPCLTSRGGYHSLTCKKQCPRLDWKPFFFYVSVGRCVSLPDRVSWTSCFFFSHRTRRWKDGMGKARFFLDRWLSLYF